MAGSLTLAYFITVSREHLVAAQMLLQTLRLKTRAPIICAGNLTAEEAAKLERLGADYIDEDGIDTSGRLPRFAWTKKFRGPGWYKQMFLRLSVDRFVPADCVVILDAEVFVLENWDERRLYDDIGRPRCFYWIPQRRKSDWDYGMYRGAAYPLRFLPECGDVMEYADSDQFRRHISGVVLFSTRNLAHLWRRLELETDIEKNLYTLFNETPSLLFSDHDFYGIAVDYGLFEKVVPTALHPNLLGWYDNHDDPVFHAFKAGAMWSMCQRHHAYATPTRYLDFANATAAALGLRLPENEYWNPGDRLLIRDPIVCDAGMSYFTKYRDQLDHTQRTRFSTMKRALELLYQAKPTGPTLVEIGTLRDSNVGGGHSTFKFGEYCARTDGMLHTVDISAEAIEFSKRAAAAVQPWVQFHLADSTEFLQNFPGTIDLLYLDGLDSTHGHEQAASEKQLGEIGAAFPHLADRCVVLLDDADLPHQGKTKFSAPFLLAHGFVTIERRYQWLFARGF
jgi:methyltransferase family protein